MHCAQRRWLEWFHFFWIFQDKIYGPGCDLFWRRFRVHLRKRWNWLFWGEMSYRYQLGLAGPLCHFFFSFIFISWKLITLQYCSGFCHTLAWISRGFTCVSHPDPLSHLPPHPVPLGLPSAPALSTCLMHLSWAGDLFHPW